MDELGEFDELGEPDELGELEDWLGLRLLLGP
jgi:hypothetical protein